MENKSDVDLFSGLTEKPPDNFLDSEENVGKNEDGDQNQEAVEQVDVKKHETLDVAFEIEEKASESEEIDNQISEEKMEDLVKIEKLENCENGGEILSEQCLNIETDNGILECLTEDIENNNEMSVNTVKDEEEIFGEKMDDNECDKSGVLEEPNEIDDKPLEKEDEKMPEEQIESVVNDEVLNKRENLPEETTVNEPVTEEIVNDANENKVDMTNEEDHDIKMDSMEEVDKDNLKTEISDSQLTDNAEQSQVYASSGVEGDLDTDSEAPRKQGKSKSEKTKAKSVEQPKQVVVTSIRRSARSNKGIGKEIFDPSHIPKSAAKRYSLPPPERLERSPSSERSPSPVSSTTSVQSRKRELESPRRGSPRVKEVAPRKKPELHSPPKKKSKEIKQPSPKVTPEVKKKNKKEIEEKMEVSDEEEDKQDEEEESPEISDDSDSDDSYNNPNRLWCICRKPHNNRFMISCDVCEDWFHGDCVGITLQRGKKMEEKHQEYVCPNCLRKSKKDTREKRKSKDDTKSQEALTQEVPVAKKRSASLDEKLSLKNFALKGKIQGKSTKPSDGTPVKKRLKIFHQSKVKKNKDPTHKKTESLSTVTVTKTEKVGTKPDKDTRKCIVSTCSNEALKGSVYCSNQCILRHAKESLKSMAKEKEASLQKLKQAKSLPAKEVSEQLKDKERVAVICRKTMKILRGLNAPRRRDLGKFLKLHPSYEVYHKTQHPPTTPSDKPLKPSNREPTHKSVNSADFYHHVEQNRKRNRYATDPDYAPDPKKISEADVDFFEKKSKPTPNPTHLNKQTSNKHSKERKISLDGPRKSIEEKERKRSIDGSTKKLEKSHGKLERSTSREKPALKEPPSSKQDKSSNSDIRKNVKKAILAILSKRSEESEDLRMHPSSISRLVDKIEDSLHKLFGETNVKYKNRYRSIMFNLKDERNHGLWRKVIIGDVTTSELVQMTAEQMASKKLAEWRQNELTQELDIIEKQEKERSFRPLTKITHKGEIAIQEDLSDLTENIHSNKNGSTAPTVAPVRKKLTSLSEEDIADPISPTLDTTSQHNEHLFDLNCKICTGKLKEESIGNVEQHAKSVVRHSTSIIMSSEAQKASGSANEPTTPTSQLFTPDVAKDKTKPSKVKRSESASNSHDSTLSPATILSSIASEKKKKPKLPSPPPLSDLAVHEDTERSSLPSSKVEDPRKLQKVPSTKVEKAEEKPQQNDKKSESTKKESSKSSNALWSGYISMLELSTFKANVYPVGGICDNLENDLPIRLVLGGRIHPKVVWEYLRKVRTLHSKQLSIIRFHAATDDDRIGYVAMLSYFGSRKRFGVVSNQNRSLVKDMYLVPLLESQPIPEELVQTGSDLSFPPNRPSMLLGIVVRHVSKPIEPDRPNPVPTSLKPPEQVEEKVPESKPVVPAAPVKQTPILLTDEELGSLGKKTSSGSLFERNKSLAPSLKFFMRKASEEEESMKVSTQEQEKDEEPYSPSAHIADSHEDHDNEDHDDDNGDDDEAYDPEKMYEEQEEYDPETAFAPVSPAPEDAPYDPEEDEEILQKEAESREMNELVEKQAFLERMQKELDEKKAKLAQVEQSLQQSTSTPVEPQRVRVDPRLARRMPPPAATPPPVTQPPPATQPSAEPASKDPLQTILSVLNMGGGGPTSAVPSILSMMGKKESTPPPLPDSTTKSDVDEPPDDAKEPPTDPRTKTDQKLGLVSYNSSPESQHADTEIGRGDKSEIEHRNRPREADRRRRSSSASSDESRDRRRGHRDDRRQKRERRSRSRSRSPNRHSRRHSPSHHHRRHGDHRREQRRSWSRDRRR